MSPKIKHPFKIQEGYFEELEARIMKATQSSLSETHGKKNVFNVPEGFFEKQYGEILDKKSNLNPAPVHPALVSKKGLAWIGVGLSTLLLLIFSYSYFGSDEINDILSKESKFIQSDVSDLNSIKKIQAIPDSSEEIDPETTDSVH